MGTWITHLRIAENLLNQIPGLNEATWACGNLAPDSGAPNTDWTVFDPPKEVTHFLRPGDDEGHIKDLDFYRQYLAPLDPLDDPVRYSFVLGYFCHLLCDNLWSKLLVGTTKQAHAQLFAKHHGGAWDAIKRDWYGLDHQYLRDHPTSLFWRVLIHAPNPPALLPFLNEPALHDQLDYIRTYYRNPDPDVAPLNRQYPYLNACTLDRFTNDATTALLHIHHSLQTREPPADQLTALALLPASATTAYDAPLGDVG